MNIEQLLFTLPYMLKGMLGVFIVTLIIMICIGLLNKFSNNTDK